MRHVSIGYPLVLAALTEAAAACTSPSGPSELLEIEAGAGAYRAGEVLELTVHNAGPRTVLIGACPSTVYATTRPETAIDFADPCPAVSIPLEPGASAEMAATLPALAAGRYVIGIEFALGDARVSGEARSAPIEVVE